MKDETRSPREIIAAALARHEAQAAIGQAALKWISEHEGVKLTKRNKPELLAACVAAAWDGCQLYLSALNGNLCIWSGNYYHSDDKEVKVCFTVGAGECPTVTTEEFTGRNTWLAHLVDHAIPKAKDSLSLAEPEVVRDLIAAYIQARETLRQALDRCPSGSEIKAILGDRRYKGLEQQLW